jgi:ATP-dependent DNA helicase RecQ
VTDSTVPVPVPVRKLAVEGDEDLIAHMKKWRRELAQQRGIPAYIVMHDSTLLDLCRREPRDVSELLHVTGIGERKAETYGAEILKALAAFRNS